MPLHPHTTAHRGNVQGCLHQLGDKQENHCPADGSHRSFPRPHENAMVRKPPSQDSLFSVALREPTEGKQVCTYKDSPLAWHSGFTLQPAPGSGNDILNRSWGLPSHPQPMMGKPQPHCLCLMSVQFCLWAWLLSFHTPERVSHMRCDGWCPLAGLEQLPAWSPGLSSQRPSHSRPTLGSGRCGPPARHS